MSAKLVMECYDSNRSTVKFSYNHADEEVTTANVRALMNGLIANGSIFEKVPASAKSAKLVVTTESEFQLGA